LNHLIKLLVVVLTVFPGLSFASQVTCNLDSVLDQGGFESQHNIVLDPNSQLTISALESDQPMVQIGAFVFGAETVGSVDIQDQNNDLVVVLLDDDKILTLTFDRETATAVLQSSQDEISQTDILTFANCTESE
jgi:hypothetical protein